MNLTQPNNQPRYYFSASNTSITYINEKPSSSKDKDIKPNNQNKPQTIQYSQTQIKNLHEIIDNLRYENESMNAMVKVKNQEIMNLKAQLKTNNTQIHQQDKEGIKEIYYVHSFKSITGEYPSVNSTDLDRAAYEIRVLTKQRDDLKKYIEKLQLEHQKSIAHNYGSGNGSINGTASNQQNAKVIEKYQEIIASITQDKNKLLEDFQGLRNQLIKRISYCENLQNQIRKYEQTQRNGNYSQLNGLNSQSTQTLVNKVNSLEAQIVKLTKQLSEKEEKMTEIQLKGSGYVQVTKQAFQSMQNNISNLQQKLTSVTESNRKELQKNATLQIQFNKVNRELVDKAKKLEIEIENIRKLQNERNELATNLSKAKAQLKQMEKKYQEKAYEIDRKRGQETLTRQYIKQLESHKQKAAQYQQLSRRLTEKLQKIEINYIQILKQNEKAFDFVGECKRKWDNYEKIIREQTDYIQRLNDRNTKRLEQLDLNIRNNINLQQKLKELAKRYEPATDEIQKAIQQNKFVKTISINY